ncbi:MAG TPA: hypothetical protein VM260_09465 [Pirellula sp.]|nr:hypothetical protein [Pirellula sp.]
MTDKRFITPPQAAKIRGVGNETILICIAKKELRAINTSLGDRPRWKIDPDDFDKWCESRSNAPKTPTPRRRKPIPNAGKSYV